jgi:hypothetical protein
MGEGYDTARIMRGEETLRGCKTGSEIPHPGQFSGKLRAAAPEGFTKGGRGKEKRKTTAQEACLGSVDHAIAVKKTEEPGAKPWSMALPGRGTRDAG